MPLLAITGLLVGTVNAAVSISYLGTDATNAAAWRSTSVAKSNVFDVDGDDAYGTAGYALIKNTSAAGTVLTNSEWATSLPSFVSLTTTTGNLWHAEVYLDIDDPTLAIAPTVGDITGPATSYGIPTVTFTLTSAQDFVFSVLNAHHEHGSRTLTFKDSMDNTLFTSADFNSNIGSAEMYFFSMQGFQAGDSFKLIAEGPGDNTGTITAVGFDVVPEPSSAILGGLGLLALLRRRR